jgi:hypothetical protein
MDLMNFIIIMMIIPKFSVKSVYTDKNYSSFYFCVAEKLSNDEISTKFEASS